MDHNFRASMRYRRQINRSFSLTNNTFVSYENDPNYDIGLSVNRPTSGYFLLANTLSGTYQWNRRLSTVTSYSFNTIVYEDQSLEGEGYRRHQFSNQFRYSFKRRLTGTLTYRYGFSEYEDNEEGDGVNQSLLAGVDYNWNRRTSVSFKAGVEHQSYDDAEREDEYAPRLEAAFGYVLGKRTNIRWSHSLGFDDTGRAGSLSGYTYRTYLSIGHGFSRRLNGSLSLSYVHSNFSDGVDDAPDSQEQSYFANAGLGYQLWRNISVQANYSYSLVTDDDDPEDYRRHRVFLGLMYSF
jgi:hypothetical protein